MIGFGNTGPPVMGIPVSYGAVDEFDVLVVQGRRSIHGRKEDNVIAPRIPRKRCGAIMPRMVVGRI